VVDVRQANVWSASSDRSDECRGWRITLLVCRENGLACHTNLLPCTIGHILELSRSPVCRRQNINFSYISLYQILPGLGFIVALLKLQLTTKFNACQRCKSTFPSTLIYRTKYICTARLRARSNESAHACWWSCVSERERENVPSFLPNLKKARLLPREQSKVRIRSHSCVTWLNKWRYVESWGWKVRQWKRSMRWWLGFWL
jgi:hypothetical protein